MGEARGLKEALLQKKDRGKGEKNGAKEGDQAGRKRKWGGGGR